MEQLNRSEARKIIMTILYQIVVYDKNKMIYEVEDVIKENLEIDNEFVKDIVYGVITYQNDLDKIANKYLNNWTIDRLGSTDIAILRMGIYELLYTDTPSIVSINEAVELAKIYSDESVAKMINAVLDKVYHEMVDHE
ncbi:MAG TPA: transcription antitermination factor NusB [Candidatus Faecisoma merdavium]|nr:transcription antitermination factor NusB [Candidatus Faecisoma merdavium]